MCDTLIKFNENGSLFGKNSDRSPNEPNLTVFIQKTKKTDNQIKHCTYIDIEENFDTFAMLLVKPSWMWGAEMGINEKSVVIGNEAVFTDSKGKKAAGLLGMDLLRLGLEKAATAKEAVDAITFFLNKYGQGGNCGFDKHFYYDNSFLVADRERAYILETSGRDWVVKSVKVHGNISNRLSLENGVDFSSGSISDNFKKRHTEPIFTYFSRSKNRQTSVFNCLENTENLTVGEVMSTLRSHDFEDSNKLYRKGSMKSVCMHNSLLGDHTTSSMIVETVGGSQTIWLTGASTPCLSLYIPTYFGQDALPVFKNETESLAYWLKREYLHRAIYAGLINETSYKKELTDIQARFIEKNRSLCQGSPTKSQLEAFSESCHLQEEAFIGRYQDQIEKIQTNPGLLPKRWRKLTISLGKNVFETDFESRNRK